MIIMEKDNYNAPNVEVIDIEIGGGFCQGSKDITYSGATHEGCMEEYW